MARRNYNRYNPYTQPYLAPIQGANAVYQPIYDPSETDRMLRLLEQRQQRYDVGQQRLAEAQSQIGGMQTYAPDLLGERLGQFTSDVQKMVDEQYGGDFGLAANDITSMIAKERANPLYRAIAEQNRQAEAYEKARLQKFKPGERFIGIQDPRTVDLSEIIQSGSLSGLEAQYAVAPNRDAIAEDIISRVKPNQVTELYKSLGEGDKKTLRDAGIKDTDAAGIFRTLSSKGVSNKRLQALETQFANSLLNSDPTLIQEFGLEGAKEEARNIIRNVSPQMSYYQETERANVLDLGDDIKDGLIPGETYGSTISLPQKSESYKKYNKEFENVQNFINQQEPELESATKLGGVAPGTGFKTTVKSAERQDWENQKAKIDAEHQNVVIPFAEKAGLSNNPDWNNLSNAEQYSIYLNTARNMSSMEEDVNKINFAARPDLDKTVKQQQLSGIRNFNIDGKDVGLDDFKKAIGEKGKELSDLVKNMTIIGKDQMGRMVVQYNKDTRKGVEEKIIRFYPSNESQIAFDPVKKVVDNFNINDAKPMKLENKDGSVWLVDYRYVNGELVPRIIEGEKSDFINVNSQNDIINFIDSNQEYITNLKTMSDYRYDQYNTFYEDFIGKQ